MVDLSNKPTIIGKKIILRPMKAADDFPYIEECLNDAEVVKLTGSSPEYDREEVFHWYNTRNEQTNRLDLAIVDKTTNVFVGEIVVNELDQLHQSMNLRILIGPRGRDRGFGTEATQLMVDYVLMNTVLNQLTLSVFAFNPRARRVYEKVGFTMESIDKNQLEYDGKQIDSINMKLTRENWLIKQNEKSAGR
ncbi:diamine N-acetyltransferase [Evansella caseinilytica]|uniref:Diamine N-acetyltransferase n=1 Tax=Evansella caseinilytica TaxID=1503961 RepID=A0A1H3NVE9_9BACI|nr:GNAT family protein [Evansella caseinilytica]SDY92643.1 diamine N-acetyltransferase [Evansella caseinilytica]